MNRYVLSLDLGTSSAHAILVDRVGRPVAGSHAALRYHRPQDGSDLAKEFHPIEVMDAVGEAVGKTLRKGGVSPKQVCAVGITSQGQGAVLMGLENRELCCCPNIDLRAVFEGAALDDEAGSEIYATTGHFPSLLLAPARLRWFQAHRPDLMESASSVVSVAGWLGHRLTGEIASEAGLDCTLGLIDLSTRRHALPLLNRLKFPVELLPPVLGSGERLGCLRPELAEKWGLPGGLPVTLAGADTQCGLLGLGVTRPGQSGAVLGWSGSVHMVMPEPMLDLEARRTWSSCYSVDSMYTVEANLGDCGHAFNWLARTLSGGQLSLEDADRLAEQAPLGGDGVLAFLGPGPLSAPNAGLRMGGIIMPTPLTFQEPTTGQILRSYLESVAYSIKANMDTISEVTGRRAPYLCLGGSMSKSGVLAGALASVLEIPVRRARDSQVSAVGAAAAAWASAGDFSSLEDSVEGQQPDLEEFLPQPIQTAEYLDHYHRWLETFHSLAPEQ